MAGDGVVARPAATERGPETKQVSSAELFFDLVFVFAITQVSVLLHGDHSPWGAVRAVVVFVPIYWAWVGTTIYGNTHDVDNARDRIGIFAIGLCSLVMALAVPAAYQHTGALFGAAYLTLRGIIAALVLRGRGIIATPFAVAVLVSGPLLLVGSLLRDTAQLVLWGIAAIVDLATPALTRQGLATTHFDAGHLPERFGLFVLIALGESIVAIGGPATRTHPHIEMLLAVAAAFALTCALWWLYFGLRTGGVERALGAATVQTDIVRQVLAYGHLAFIAAIIAVAVGLSSVVAHPDHHLDTAAATLLYGGCALYLAAFSYTRHQMFDDWWTTRWTTAALLLALLPAATQLPALVTLCILAAAITALDVLEHALARRDTPGKGAATRTSG